MSNGKTGPKGFPKTVEPTTRHTYTTTIGVFPGGNPIVLIDYPGGKSVKQLLDENDYNISDFSSRDVRVQINGIQADLDTIVNPGDKVVVVGKLKGA